MDMDVAVDPILQIDWASHDGGWSPFVYNCTLTNFEFSCYRCFFHVVLFMDVYLFANVLFARVKRLQ